MLGAPEAMKDVLPNFEATQLAGTVHYYCQQLRKESRHVGASTANALPAWGANLAGLHGAHRRLDAARLKERYGASTESAAINSGLHCADGFDCALARGWLMGCLLADSLETMRRGYVGRDYCKIRKRVRFRVDDSGEETPQ
jgi:hypothetical protein